MPLLLRKRLRLGPGQEDVGRVLHHLREGAPTRVWALTCACVAAASEARLLHAAARHTWHAHNDPPAPLPPPQTHTHTHKHTHAPQAHLLRELHGVGDSLEQCHGAARAVVGHDRRLELVRAAGCEHRTDACVEVGVVLQGRHGRDDGVHGTAACSQHGLARTQRGLQAAARVRQPLGVGGIDDPSASMHTQCPARRGWAAACRRGCQTHGGACGPDQLISARRVWLAAGGRRGRV
jgi:hypothetical protein